MPVELGGIKFPRVHRISTVEQAAFVHHRVPGFAGDVVQDLGRQSVQLRIEGIFFGTDAKDSLEKLRGLHTKREAADFIADIMGTAYAAKVTLDRLEVSQSALEPDQFSYSLIVSEYVEPPAAGSADAGLLQDEAKSRLDVAGLADELSLGSAPELTNPFEPLKGALEPLKSAGDSLMQAAGGLKSLFGV